MQPRWPCSTALFRSQGVRKSEASAVPVHVHARLHIGKGAGYRLTGTSADTGAFKLQTRPVTSSSTSASGDRAARKDDAVVFAAGKESRSALTSPCASRAPSAARSPRPVGRTCRRRQRAPGVSKDGVFECLMRTSYQREQ